MAFWKKPLREMTVLDLLLLGAIGLLITLLIIAAPYMLMILL